MYEVFHHGITEELYQAVLEKTWTIVKENIGHDSDMKGRNKKVWTVDNANRQCSYCGIHVSDKPEHGGAQRCRGARHTVARFTGMCCNCRFDTEDWTDSMTNRHSCQTCKRRRHNWERALVWRGVDERPIALIRHGIDEQPTLRIDTDASFEVVGSTYRRAMRTPLRPTRQIQRDEIDNFLAQGRHNAWAGSNQEIQQASMTKRRLRRLNRCRPSVAMDAHRHDHGDNNDGAQSMATQNNNKHRQ